MTIENTCTPAYIEQCIHRTIKHNQNNSGRESFFRTDRSFEDMKHYADNLGTNIAAMLKVRQVRSH